MLSQDANTVLTARLRQMSYHGLLATRCSALQCVMVEFHMEGLAKLHADMADACTDEIQRRDAIMDGTSLYY